METVDLKTLADTPISQIAPDLHRRVAASLTKSYCAVVDAVFNRKVLEGPEAAEEFSQLLHIRFAQFGELTPRQWKGAMRNAASLALQNSDGGYIPFTIAEIIDSLHTAVRIRRNIGERGNPLQLKTGPTAAEKYAAEHWAGDPQSAFIRNASQWVTDESQHNITFMRFVPDAVKDWFKGFWKANPELFKASREVAVKQFALSAYDIRAGLGISTDSFWDGIEFLQAEFDRQVKAKIAAKGQRLIDYFIPNWALFWSNALVFAYMEHLKETAVVVAAWSAETEEITEAHIFTRDEPTKPSAAAVSPMITDLNQIEG